MKFDKKYLKTIIIGLAVFLLTVGVSVAAVTLTSPENIAGTPQVRPTPTPQPTSPPTPTASPSPPPVAPTAINLSSNLSGPFYIGDTLRLVAQLNQPTPDITVTLYNLGNPVVTATTDNTGKAIFDRTPINPFDYYVTASIPE